MIDAGRYIGRPYREPFGCFELVRTILLDQGVELPDYAQTVSEAEKADALRRLIAEHCIEVTQPKAADIALLRLARGPGHIGYMLSSVDMLHAFRGHGAHIERIDSLRWQHRVLGFWRLRAGHGLPASVQG